LDPFDHCIKEQLMVKYYVRYMDDFVILSNDKGFLKDIRSEIDDYLSNRLGLILNTNVVMINKRANGLRFLGSRIYPRLLRIKNESLKRCMMFTIA
ncbi:RNA-directed DNA polymerase (Reverse transcriptase), partial [Candidatus Magnetobacterium bavaricum]